LKVGLSNANIAELLAQEAESHEGIRRRAFKKAARSALLWPEQAHGRQARPATAFVSCVLLFESTVTIHAKGKRYSAERIFDRTNIAGAGIKWRGGSWIEVIPGTSPLPTCGGCFPDPEKLIANQKTMPEICEYLGVDSLGYLDLEGMIAATGKAPNEFASLVAFHS
jgi:hypothetical protein